MPYLLKNGPFSPLPQALPPGRRKETAGFLPNRALLWYNKKQTAKRSRAGPKDRASWFTQCGAGSFGHTGRKSEKQTGGKTH